MVNYLNIEFLRIFKKNIQNSNPTINFFPNSKNKSSVSNLIHQGNEFGRLKIDNNNTFLSGFLNIEIYTECPLIGVYCIRSNGDLLGSELVYPIFSDGSLVIKLPLTKDVSWVAIRNSSSMSVLDDLKIISTDIESFQDKNSFSKNEAKLNGAAKKFILVHAFGKSGTITLQKTIEGLDNFLVARSHYFNINNLKDNKLWLPSSRDDLKGTISAATIFNQLNFCRRGRIPHTIINSLRHPETLYISSIFQNQGLFFKKNDVEVESIIKVIESNVENFISSLQSWWLNEFFPLYDINIDDLEKNIKKRGLIFTLSSDIFSSDIIFFCIENGDDAFREAIWHATGYNMEFFERQNEASKKPYYPLYISVIEKLKRKGFKLPLPSSLKRIYDIFYRDEF